MVGGETQMGSQVDLELLLCLSRSERKVFPVDLLYNGIIVVGRGQNLQQSKTCHSWAFALAQPSLPILLLLVQLPLVL